MRKLFIKWGGVAGLALLFVLSSQISVFAQDTYAANAGMRPGDAGILNNNSGAALAVGSPLQFIHLTGRIVGPNAAGGTDAATETIRPAPLGGALGRQVGSDTVTESFSGVAGKFWHQVNVEAGSRQTFFVRAWDRDPADPAARFGESATFYSNSDPRTPPTPTALASFATIFPKAVPANPTFNPAVVTRGGSTRNPAVNFSANAKLGTRYVVFRLLNEDRSAKSGPTTVNYNSTGFAVPTGGANLNYAPSLLRTDDDATYICQATAYNSFGNSETVEQSVYVPENGDDTVPFPVTDLQISSWDPATRRLTLRWSAPYDTDRYGAVAAIDHYAFAAYTAPLVDLPVYPFSAARTNPDEVSNWGDATLIVPPEDGAVVPAAYGEAQEATLVVPHALGSSFFVGLKSYDAPNDALPNVSYISNVVGVGVAGDVVAGGAAGPITYSLNTGLNAMAVLHNMPLTVASSDGSVSTGGITTIAQFVNAINAVAGSSVVTTIGWMQSGSMVGYYISGDGYVATEGAGIGAASDVPLVRGRSYQLSTSGNVTIVVSGE